MKSLKAFCLSLVDPEFVPTGLRTAVVVGSILLIINHGSAILSGRMSSVRWFSGLLTYLVPFVVNVHGQYVSRSRRESVRTGRSL